MGSETGFFSVDFSVLIVQNKFQSTDSDLLIFYDLFTIKYILNFSPHYDCTDLVVASKVCL